MGLSASGGTQFLLIGMPGVKYRIESSPDLIQWSHVAEGVADGDTIALQPGPHDAAAAAQRFYRAAAE